LTQNADKLKYWKRYETKTQKEKKKMSYQQMYQKFLNGEITKDQWISFCRDYFNDVIMTNPDIVGVMQRLKNR
jgi:hypothetical protein